MSNRVLVVDDDQRILDLVSRYLIQNGFVLMTALRAAEARVIMTSFEVDILVVDELSGDIDGITLPRIDVWRYAFVLRPLLDIWPNGVCPKNKTPLRDYWPHVAGQPLQEGTLEGVETTSSF